MLTGRQREREERRIGDTVTEKAGVGDFAVGRREVLQGSPGKNTDIDFLHYYLHLIFFFNSHLRTSFFLLLFRKRGKEREEYQCA